MRRLRWMTGTGLAIGLTIWAGTAAATATTFSTSPSQTIVLHSGTLANWSVRNLGGTDNGTPTGTCSSSVAGLAVTDGILDPGGTLRGDSLDNGFTTWIDDVQFVSPDTVDVTGDTLTAGPVSMSGLEVTVQYKAFATPVLLRGIVTLHNPTGNPITVGYRLLSNFGSDGLTETRGSGPSRSWRVTSDSATNPSDPVVVFVAAGPDASAPRTGAPLDSPNDTAFTCSGAEGSALASTKVIVPPGETLYTMQFIGLADTNADGVALGETFGSNPASGSQLVSDLTTSQLLATFNWTFFGEFVVAGGNASWDVGGFAANSNRQATGGECASAPGVGIIDAQLDAPFVDDALDHQVLFVGGESFVPPVAVTQSGQVVTVGPATLGGLDVTLQYAALQGSPTLRSLATIRNPTGAAIATTVELATNFGSDANTTVAATSSGDAAIATGDRWSVTADDLTTPTDPVNTCVVAGPGSPVVTPALATEVFTCTTRNGLLATFALTVGAGETRSLVFFNQLHDTVSAATADTGVFDAAILPGAHLLGGLDNPTLVSVANWAFCRGATHGEAICRVDGLSADVAANGTVGKSLDKLLARLTAAKTALQKSATAAGAGKKGAARHGIKAASGALKAFEKLLKSKKLAATLPDVVRTRLTATSAEVRAQLKGLPLAI